jgi:hypothetical protein
MSLSLNFVICRIWLVFTVWSPCKGWICIEVHLTMQKGLAMIEVLNKKQELPHHLQDASLHTVGMAACLPGLTACQGRCCEGASQTSWLLSEGLPALVLA